MNRVRKNVNRRIKVIRNDKYLVELLEQKLFDVMNSDSPEEFKKNKVQLEYLKAEIVRRMEENL